MSRPVPNRCVEFIKAEEKCVLTCYDTDGAGVPTIGWGSTFGLTKADVGKLTITVAQATMRLRTDLATAAQALERKIGAVVNDLSESQYSALVSFVFNLGTGNPAKKEWRIWQLLRGRAFDQVPGEMGLFVNVKDANGVRHTLRGLVNRRAAEVALWHEDGASSVVAPPSSVTRTVETPPTPPASSAKPLVQSKSFMTTGLGVLTSVGTAAAAVSDKIAPFAASNHIVETIHSNLALISAGVVILGFVFVWLKAHRGKSA
jgi:lysozyme